MRKLSSLPRPDDYGNYWFRSNDTETAPAIFVSNTAPMLYGRPRYFVSLGSHGMVWNRQTNSLALFDCPQEALNEIQRRLK